jgi:hypothetical protein
MIVLTLLLALITEVRFRPRCEYFKNERLLLIFYSAKSDNGVRTRKRLIFQL